MQHSTESNDEELWDGLTKALQADGSERLLLSVASIWMKQILKVQMQRTGGDVARSVSNAVAALRKMEATIGKLHEHERHMDKTYFEELVKADTFMIRGYENRTGGSLVWVREGHRSKGVWGLKLGSPKAHAYIRYMVYFLQHACAKSLTENVNLKVMQRYLSLSSDLFDALIPEGRVTTISTGVPQLLAVPLNMAKAAIPSLALNTWMIVEDREDIHEIVINAEDIPHWYYDPGDERKERGARRRPSDPREYGCWKRCLSEDRKISLKDTFNPDPETWLEDCGVERAKDSNMQANTFGELDAIPESQDDADDW